VTLRVARAAKVIGMPVTKRSAWMRCAPGPARQRRSAGVLTVTPPPYRFDMRSKKT
jgi:phenylalanyl-tRNA synthetase beta chain